MDIQLQAGGMHLLARIPGCKSDRDLVARATAQGLAPAALSPWVIERTDNQGFLLSFTNIPKEAAMEMAMRLKQPSTENEIQDCFGRFYSPTVAHRGSPHGCGVECPPSQQWYS
jgi:hypothetical protein